MNLAMARDYLDIYRKLLSVRSRGAQVRMLTGRNGVWQAMQLAQSAPSVEIDHDSCLETDDRLSKTQTPRVKTVAPI